MNAKGPVFKYGDNIDTDVIIPARYLNTQSPAELAAHCMEDIDKTFVTRVKAGDIMVGGENFGCGSSREHAPVAIKAAGIDCVIAKSFARIFYRNAINIGLPILECPAASEAINEGDVVAINFDTGVITVRCTFPADMECRARNLLQYLYENAVMPSQAADVLAAANQSAAARRTGAALLPPPPYSITTATANRGCCTGPYPMSTEFV